MELLLSFIAGLFLGLIIGLFKISSVILNPKTRGDWGEMTLERLLESSGLQKGVHFTTQESFKNDNKELLRPDVVVNLPNNRHVVIDSKICLDARSVKENIKNLKNKSYDGIKELNTPDFVIMFIPVESVFAKTLKKDSEIIEFAWKNNILLTAPSTLLATLKIINLSWQNENQQKNALEIAEESGKLYDKFVGLLADMETVKNRFEDISTKLEGRGGLIRQAEKIRTLGAKAQKQIPERMLD